MSGNNDLQNKIKSEIAELSASVSGLVESFKKLKKPLTESKETVPQATNQLDKISNQTEVATQQMLDRIEKITEREGSIIDGLNNINDKIEEQKTQDISGIIKELIKLADTNMNDAFMIMDALQFQDITAQQMNHAASLLEDLENKLGHVLVTVSGSKVTKTPNDEPGNKKVRAYDPHADLFEKKTDQLDIDSLFEKKTN